MIKAEVVLVGHVLHVRVAGAGFLDDVKLESAVNGGAVGASVSHVEQCRCLAGYIGQFCEDCEPGYRRDPVNGGPHARCVPCNCHGHSDQCDVNTGQYRRATVTATPTSVTSTQVSLDQLSLLYRIDELV